MVSLHNTRILAKTIKEKEEGEKRKRKKTAMKTKMNIKVMRMWNLSHKMTLAVYLNERKINLKLSKDNMKHWRKKQEESTSGSDGDNAERATVCVAFIMILREIEALGASSEVYSLLYFCLQSAGVTIVRETLVQLLGPHPVTQSTTH